MQRHALDNLNLIPYVIDFSSEPPYDVNRHGSGVCLLSESPMKWRICMKRLIIGTLAIVGIGIAAFSAQPTAVEAKTQAECRRQGAAAPPKGSLSKSSGQRKQLIRACTQSGAVGQGQGPRTTGQRRDPGQSCYRLAYSACVPCCQKGPPRRSLSVCQKYCRG